MNCADTCLSMAMLALVTSCASTPQGAVSIEARGAIDSPALLEAVLIVLAVVATDGEAEATSNTGIGSNSHWYGEDDVTFVRSFGMRATINSPIVDLVGGIDEHSFGSQDLSEVSFGLRKRFEESESGAGYIEVLARRGFDIETTSGSRDYDGIEIGRGFLASIDERWFLDVGIAFESTLRRLDIDGDREYLSDVLLNIGLGFSL